jgi:phage terminase large subunit
MAVTRFPYDPSRSDAALRPRRVEYAEHVLAINPWGKMKTIYDLIDQGATKLLIRSCNGAGKTTLLGSLVMYEIEHYEHVTVICSGATATQLKQNLWARVKKFGKLAGLTDAHEITATEFKLTETRKVVCINPAKAESAQGNHNDRVVLIIDEATALDAEKIQALISNCTGADILIIFTYNPIKPEAFVADLESEATLYRFEESVPFEEAVGSTEIRKAIVLRDWISVGINAFEHPNVITGTEIIPGAITRDYVETLLRIDSIQCSVDYPGAIVLPWSNIAYHPTPEALARVCGRWSDSQSSGFISGSIVVESWKVEPQSGLRVLGCDIGGGGDDPSMFTVFVGNQQICFESLKTGEYGLVTKRIIELIYEHNIEVVGIDDTGVGHGVTDRLFEHHQTRPLPSIIVPVNFGAKPKGFERLRCPMNARAEMYLLLEKEIRGQHIRLLYDKELQKELTSWKIVTSKNSETIRLEDKNIIKKRIGRSPDKADATAIARYAVRLLRYHNQPKLL